MHSSLSIAFLLIHSTIARKPSIDLPPPPVRLIGTNAIIGPTLPIGRPRFSRPLSEFLIPSVQPLINPVLARRTFPPPFPKSPNPGVPNLVYFNPFIGPPPGTVPLIPPAQRFHDLIPPPNWYPYNDLLSRPIPLAPSFMDLEPAEPFVKELKVPVNVYRSGGGVTDVGDEYGLVESPRLASSNRPVALVDEDIPEISTGRHIQPPLVSAFLGENELSSRNRPMTADLTLIAQPNNPLTGGASGGLNRPLDLLSAFPQLRGAAFPQLRGAGLPQLQRGSVPLPQPLGLNLAPPLPLNNNVPPPQPLAANVPPPPSFNVSPPRPLG